MKLIGEFCVYLVSYGGNKHPPFYIGSSSTKKVLSGKYLGSPRSKKWKDVVKCEQKENPHLYQVDILSYHSTRKEALHQELEEQLKRDVVKSEQYYNMSLASVNGFFGMDVSGENNPRFGAEVSDKTRKEISNSNKGKCVVSTDGKNWFTVSTDEYRNNRNKYFTPKGEFNHVVTEKTRERVRNGTHHFCDKEVQRKIHEKRKGFKMTDEQKQRMSKARKDMNVPFWKLSFEHTRDGRWGNIDDMYNIYCNNVCLSCKSWKKDIVAKIVENVNDIPEYWCSKMVVRFKNGWNPLTDYKFREVVLNESN